MPSATITTEQLDDLFQAPNWPDLLAEYAAESAIDGLGAPNPQNDTYHALEQAGALKVVCARLDGELVGFITVLLSVLPHFGRLVGICESYFVAARHRRSGAGLLILLEAERIALEAGAVGFLVSAPLGGRLAGVLQRRGYEPASTVYFKPLGQLLGLQTMTDEAVAMVRRAERAAMAMPQVTLETRHHLHAGLYARTVRVPAGVAITGAFIKIPTLLIVNGRCEVFTGSEVLEMDGHHVLQASAGRKQVFLAHADTDITMVFATSATTVEAAEEEFTDEADLLQTRWPHTRGESPCLVS